MGPGSLPARVETLSSLGSHQKAVKKKKNRWPRCVCYGLGGAPLTEVPEELPLNEDPSSFGFRGLGFRV